MDQQGLPPAERVFPVPLMVISFVNTGFFLLVYVMGSMVMLGLREMPYEEFAEMILHSAPAWAWETPEPMFADMVRLIHESGFSLFLILTIRTVLRLRGLLQMWRGRLVGFHLYAFAQLAGIFAPHLVLPLAYLGFSGPLAAVAMTMLYGTYARRIPR